MHRINYLHFRSSSVEVASAMILSRPRWSRYRPGHWPVFRIIYRIIYLPLTCVDVVVNIHGCSIKCRRLFPICAPDSDHHSACRSSETNTRESFSLESTVDIINSNSCYAKMEGDLISLKHKLHQFYKILNFLCSISKHILSTVS